MDKKLQNKLYRKFPELFRQHTLPMNESAMYWGCQCGDGWFNLIYQLSEWLNWQQKMNGYPHIEFTTIKEKRGKLRIYSTLTDEDKIKFPPEAGYRIRDVIDFVESQSSYICEDCGQPGKLKKVKGWYFTACDKDNLRHTKRLMLKTRRVINEKQKVQ